MNKIKTSQTFPPNIITSSSNVQSDNGHSFNCAKILRFCYMWHNSHPPPKKKPYIWGRQRVPFEIKDLEANSTNYLIVLFASTKHFTCRQLQ